MSEQDSVRSGLLGEANDDKVRAIIQKYIVTPRFRKQHSDSKALKGEDYAETLARMSGTVSTCNSFLLKFVQTHQQIKQLELEASVRENTMNKQ